MNERDEIRYKIEKQKELIRAKVRLLGWITEKDYYSGIVKKETERDIKKEKKVLKEIEKSLKT